jgi:hypothetical protein
VANPTFNIQDLVAPVGRQPANPFDYPSTAQQTPQPKASKPKQKKVTQQPEPDYAT